MTERSVFLAALEYDDPGERSAYLDRACAGDAALRAGVEQLLTAHERSGTFMGQPAPVRLAGDLAAEPGGDDTRTAPGTDVGLDFLEPSDKPGSIGRVGHYEVQEVVGRGGMGVVVKAFDEQLHRVVAIKVMAPQLATSAAARLRFAREARSAAAVTHDHVITIHAVADAGPLPYIVMQFVGGVSLQDRLDRSGPLPLVDVLRIGMQTAAGLAAAHAQGLVHRDVKPANILLENGVERVKLTDFGLARAADDASLTQSGAVAGTPTYMSPEQAEGKSLDHRSDLFSLGSVLYAMCTGRPPFRAGTSMATLKRVCEDTPTAVREVNPEVPDWLTELIAKLHAKDPAFRFQSAAEVAEVLGQYLAHVQHPSILPMPAVVKSAGDPTTLGRRSYGGRRWAVAAAVLAVMLAVLGTTEATGVTNVRATVIRIATPDGTLVVETDDPDVKVTVEGDGGLVVTGAGLEEIRLKPGNYRVVADRDGKRVPLDRDLITVSRRGRITVRVKLETAPSAPSGRTETGVFVLITAGKEWRFDTLAEAVLVSTDGDTVEVRGNGPFVTDPVDIKRALTIRAGVGFRPSITLVDGKPDGQPPIRSLLTTESALTLEGLELVDTTAQRRASQEEHYLVTAWGSTLRLLNCRLLLIGSAQCVSARTPNLIIRNCEVIATGPEQAICWHTSNGKQCVIENCVVLGRPLILGSDRLERASVRLTENTFLTKDAAVICNFKTIPDLAKPPPSDKPLRLEVTDNILASDSTILWQQHTAVEWKPVQGTDAETLLFRMIDWSEKRNVYAPGASRLRWFIDWKGLPRHGPTNLTEWNHFWKQADTGSNEGHVQFQGGSVLTRLAKEPEKLGPADCRLREGSAGYRAGKDGKDLGADIDLVGPGAAYERWKKTPDYQHWLKETEQIRAAAPPSERNAFVLLTAGKERTFDTLAEAVEFAADGDTIEVRGNGPFVTDPVLVRDQRLIIRAGTGYRPVLRISNRRAHAREPLLRTNAALVMEGLELQYSNPQLDRGVGPVSVVFGDGERQSLLIVNCRFRADVQPWPRCVYAHAPNSVLIVRNCEFYCPDGYAVVAGLFAARRVMDNCVHVGANTHMVAYHSDERGEEIELTHNTVVSSSAPIQFYLADPPPASAVTVVPTRIRATSNVLDAHSGLGVYRSEEYHRIHAKDPTPEEYESLVRRLVAWQDRDNLYRVGGCAVGFWAFKGFTVPPRHKSPDEWKRFWGTPQETCQEGRMRYRGGNLLTRLAAAPDQLSPEDFRLRPDSAGYRAGKDGKDLGADVDLVGPGPAYERWKKTSDYQTWLKESGQLKK